jgi:putative transposase
MVTPAAKREAVAHLKGAHEMSERRACRVIDCQRMTIRYRSRRPDDPRLRERLVALARERRRFGYRRLLIFLRREDFVVNHKRLFRIYREERLMVRKRGGRKRALGPRTPMPVPALPHDLWVLDFVFPLAARSFQSEQRNRPTFRGGQFCKPISRLRGPNLHAE